MAFDCDSTEQLIQKLKSLDDNDPFRETLGDAILDEIIFRHSRAIMQANLNQLRLQLIADLADLKESIRKRQSH